MLWMLDVVDARKMFFNGVLEKTLQAQPANPVRALVRRPATRCPACRNIHHTLSPPHALFGTASARQMRGWLLRQAAFMMSALSSLTEYPVLQIRPVPAGRELAPSLCVSSNVASITLAVVDQQEGNASLALAISALER